MTWPGRTGREVCYLLSPCKVDKQCYWHTSVFSFLRQLSTWHCPHLLLRAVLRRQPCSNRSISPSHSSKPAARCCSGRKGQTDGRTRCRPAPHTLSKQEALLPQTDRATRYVSRNLLNCCTTVGTDRRWIGVCPVRTAVWRELPAADRRRVSTALPARRRCRVATVSAAPGTSADWFSPPSHPATTVHRVQTYSVHVNFVRYAHTHAHTHPFNGPFSGTTQVSRYQKGKTNVDFTEARDSEWQWHQLGHMQVCTSLQPRQQPTTHANFVIHLWS